MKQQKELTMATTSPGCTVKLKCCSTGTCSLPKKKKTTTNLQERTRFGVEKRGNINKHYIS